MKFTNEQINEFFDPVPILRGKLFNAEMIGIKKLKKLADEIFKDHNAADVLYSDRPFYIEEDGDAFLLNIRLPGVKKEEIGLWVKKEELILSVDGRKRNLLLPRALKGLIVTKAKCDNDIFTIRFEAE